MVSGTAILTFYAGVARSPSGTSSFTAVALNPSSSICSCGLICQQLMLCVTDVDQIKAVCSASGGDAEHPVFACPVLRQALHHQPSTSLHKNLCLSQTPAILQYLGNVHGSDHTRHVGNLAPQSAHWELITSAYCLQLALDAADIWTEAYGKKGPFANAEEREQTEQWLSVRFCNKWLAHLERTFGCFSGAYFFGDHPTYADYSLMNAFQCVEEMFSEIDFAAAPSLVRWYYDIQVTPVGCCALGAFL